MLNENENDNDQMGDPQPQAGAHALFEVSCKAIVFNGTRDRILLAAYREGYHSLPGGHMEHGETPDQALLRELDEEIGFSPDCELSRVTFAWMPGPPPKAVLAYSCCIDESTPLPRVDREDERCMGGVWVSLEDALTSDTNNYLILEYQTLVQTALQLLGAR